MVNSYPVVDVFCGVGGLSFGFFREGFGVLAGIDSNPSCNYPFEKNIGSKFIQADISEIPSRDIVKLYPNEGVRILIGCAPCQPFSNYTNKILKKDKRQWSLLKPFGQIIADIEPEVATMENVPNLATKPIFKEFVETLRQNQYYVSWSNVFCPDYGVPQQRTRLVLFASKYGEIEFIEPTHSPDQYVTVRQTIGDLPSIHAGETHGDDPLHRASLISELNLRRIQSSVPGGTWGDWDEDLLADCHKKESGKSYYNVYGRMEWDKISPTITTQFTGFGNGRFGHPQQDRALSLREGACLQTFPKDYEFFDPDSHFFHKQVAKHIGNAVPVKLAMAIAKSIKWHLIANGA